MFSIPDVRSVSFFGSFRYVMLVLRLDCSFTGRLRPVRPHLHNCIHKNSQDKSKTEKEGVLDSSPPLLAGNDDTRKPRQSMLVAGPKLRCFHREQLLLLEREGIDHGELRQSTVIPVPLLGRQ